MPDFKFVAPFEPTGDQPAAIERLSAGLANGVRHQTLLGATGTGKTATLAWTIANHNKPTLVLAHNKTLAAQLYAEFREFFPENAVEYFVSYFDYYQPEAYLPRSDTYIEKDSSRNDEIDRLRHAATHALFERRDVIIVASVSCIYGLGAPVDYGADGAQAAHRRPVPARRRPAPPGGPPVPAQRRRARPGPLPCPRRHAGAPARLGGDARPDRVLRRSGRADHRARPADRRAAGRAQGGQRLPGDALRHAAGQAQGSDRRHRGRDGGAGGRPRGRGSSAGGRPAPSAHDVRPRDDARARLLHRHRELLAPPVAPRGGQPAVDAARLLPAGLAARRRRVAHDDPAGRRDVQERPDAQGDPGRLRLPAAVGARQPAADVRGVRGDRPPGDLHERDAGSVRARAEQGRRPAAHPADRGGRPDDHGPPDREPDRRPARGDPRRASSAASGRSSRR